jgi:glycosyltransferase involved in cell wall biosynthesis
MNKGMKIFGNCLIKNETDIIEETLVHAANWCDRIFVFDNGSTDGTWEKVLSLASKMPEVVVPFKSDGVPYRDSLRMETFNHYRNECGPDDWWCKLDADELYVDNPKTFLADVPKRHHVVWGVNFQFYLTDIDEIKIGTNPELYPPHSHAESSLRYYRCEYSEVRFFRYRPRLLWENGSAPRHMGVVHPRRIRFKHYQYRSPAQIDLRLKTRQEAMANGCGTFQGYCDETSWRQKVVPASSCLCIDAPTPFQIEEEKIPRHLEPTFQRMAKLLMHTSGLWA